MLVFPDAVLLPIHSATHAGNMPHADLLQPVMRRSKDLDSTLVCSSALFPRTPNAVPVMDFFGSVPRVAASDAAAAGEAVSAPAGTAACGGAAGSMEPGKSEADSAGPAAAGTPSLEAQSGLAADPRHQRPATVGVAAGWAVQQGGAGADVPLLLCVAAVTAAAAAAYRWSRNPREN